MALVRSLPGFQNGSARVNGTRLHYFAGGRGEPLVLLPGWPETWWAFHKMMPRLAEHYRVIAVDIRGMGASDKPVGGYDGDLWATYASRDAIRAGNAWYQAFTQDIIDDKTYGKLGMPVLGLA